MLKEKRMPEFVDTGVSPEQVPMKEGIASSFFKNSIFKDDLFQPKTIQDQLAAKKTEATKLAAAPTDVSQVFAKPALSLNDYQQPALAILANAVVAQFKVAVFGPQVTSGAVSAVKQLQQLGRIYDATASSKEEKVVLGRELMRAYFTILFKSFNEGYLKGDAKLNSATAYQGSIEGFVRKLL